jgi:hypothetical protein
MPIIAAAVESNGWVLRLDVSGTLTVPKSNFEAYALDPDGVARVALAVSSPGFVKSGDTAVAGMLARSLVATRPLRLPVDPLNPTVQTLDETDVGGGVLRLRLALSEEVYAGDTGLTLAVLAGWRAGEAAASDIAVANDSTVAPPQPVFRWVLPPYQTTSGVFRASLIVGTVNPQGFEPAAGVRFTATDGTTVRSVWTTALATDDSLGDNLRCYTVEIDPGAAPALNAGLLRIDAEVYPWLGAMRSTDATGTRLMTGLRTAAYGHSAQSPWCIGYDPAGTRYGRLWTYVDPVNGTLTANAAMVATTLAGAKAVAPASRPRTVSTAIAAIALVNRTLPAANGQAAQARSGDGAFVVLAPGTHTGFNGTSISSTFAVPEIPLRIIGDPDDADPRANCIIRTGTAAATTRTPRMRVQNCTVQTASSAALTGSDVLYMFIDNCEIRGAAGSENSTTWPLNTGAPPAGTLNWYLTGSRVWRLGTTISNANRWTGLVRNCEHSRRVTGVCFVRNRWIGKSEDGFTASNTAEGYGTATSSNLAAMEDLVVAFNDLRAMRWGAFAFSAAPSAISGVAPQSGRHRRHLILNNILERISGTNGASTTSDTLFGYGESTHVVMDTIIIEGNTVAGSGYNAFYSDPVPTTLADVDSQTNVTVRIRHANNATDRNASKHDDFSDPSVVAVRNAAGPPESLKGGWRPACTGAWSVHFGVGMEAHVDLSRSGTIANFRRAGGSGFVGLRGAQYDSATSPAYALDRSENGSDSGGGDYVPQAGSPLLGRVRRANSDRDFAGTARQIDGAAGALEGLGGPTLSPYAATMPQTAGMPDVAASGALAAASAVHAQAVTAPVVSIAFTLAAAGAVQTVTASAGDLSWFGVLQPQAGVSAVRSNDAGMTEGDVGTLLQPEDAGLLWVGIASVLFPNSASLAGGVLTIPADPRTLTIS